MMKIEHHKTAQILFPVLILFLAVSSIFAQQKQSRQTEASTVAFVNVNVIPMDSEHVLQAQTVLIRNGRIAEIGSYKKVRVPKDALKIDGKNRYLMPGLIDMHVHAFPDDRELGLYVANGVTTVRNMAGSPRLLKLREQINRGELFAPNFYTCGPFLIGFKDVAATKRIVQDQCSAGYDCIKIYNILDWTKEAYIAAVETANHNHVPAVGHLPYNLPIEDTLIKGRQTVEHTEQFLYAFFNKFPDRTDETHIRYLATLLKNNGIAVDATLYVYHAIALMADDNEFQKLTANPHLKYVLKSVREKWINNNDYRKRFKAGDVPSLNRTAIFLRKVTKALYDAGIKILLGTDSSADQPFIIPGFSIHEELRELVSAGLTPFQALQAGTMNAAEILNAAQEFGSVTTGKRADLLLLEHNPLEDVANVAHRAGVMIRGKWYSESELQKRLGELATVCDNN